MNKKKMRYIQKQKNIEKSFKQKKKEKKNYYNYIKEWNKIHKCYQQKNYGIQKNKKE